MSEMIFAMICWTMMCNGKCAMLHHTLWSMIVYALFIYFSFIIISLPPTLLSYTIAILPIKNIKITFPTSCHGVRTFPVAAYNLGWVWLSCAVSLLVQDFRATPYGDISLNRAGWQRPTVTCPSRSARTRYSCWMHYCLIMRYLQD